MANWCDSRHQADTSPCCSPSAPSQNAGIHKCFKLRSCMWCWVLVGVDACSHSNMLHLFTIPLTIHTRYSHSDTTQPRHYMQPHSSTLSCIYLQICDVSWTMFNTWDILEVCLSSFFHHYSHSPPTFLPCPAPFPDQALFTNSGNDSITTWTMFSGMHPDSRRCSCSQCGSKISCVWWRLWTDTDRTSLLMMKNSLDLTTMVGIVKSRSSVLWSRLNSMLL